MNPTYSCTIEVRGYELDSFGHLNHGIYIHYLEHARWKLLAEEGITLKNFDQWQRWPVIVRIEADFLRPTFMGNQLEVKTSVADRTRATLTFDQQIYLHDTVVFRAKVKLALINEKGRPTGFPPDFDRIGINQETANVTNVKGATP